MSEQPLWPCPVCLSRMVTGAALKDHALREHGMKFTMWDYAYAFEPD